MSKPSLLQTYKILFHDVPRHFIRSGEDVKVRSVEGQQVIVLELCVHPEDVGNVIGRHGRTAETLRTIFGAAGMKLQKHVMVEIIGDQFFQFKGKVVTQKKWKPWALG